MLDASQEAVVELPDSAFAAVLGAAGSGKTTTIVEVVADRILNRGWDPRSVLVLTSARGAATRLRDRIAVIHDGIDAQGLKPNPSVSLRLGPNGPRLSRDIPVVTYVSRNIEPMRGSHVMFRSLPGLLAIDPRLRVVIVGGKGTSYSGQAPGGKTWFEVFRERIDQEVDWSRVHFVGNLPYDQFVKVLQVSSAHLYMTYPFVLSWSSIEAMALECRLVASDTAPVREIVEEGVNGRLFDFFDHKALVERVRETLADKAHSAEMAREGRRIALERYDFQSVCLPKWRAFLGVG